MTENFFNKASLFICPAANTRVISNKLVTIFARYHDNFIMTKGFSLVYQFHKTGSGQFLPLGQIYLSPGLAKIAPWCLARRDSFSAKAPGLTVGVTAPPTLTAYTREPLCVRF